ncbi:MFS transporter [Pigmentiphaga soli]|uniref:MFS transporter n=1 Tax=Pigmentiphaga soli TaxID=1007095 RepID=A0ABP8HB13_9BURK
MGKRLGNWYFGWNIVAVAAILTLLTVGMRMGIGPFFLPMARDLGFSRSLLAGIVALGMLCYGLAMPVAGHLAATRGTRFVLVAGTALIAASTAATVMAHSAIGFLLAFGVGLSVGLGMVSPVALTPVLTRWFIRRRGMALLFLSTGSMGGMALLTPVFTYAIDVAGWRATLAGFAAFFVLFTIPAALFIVRDEPPPGADLEPSAAGRAPAPKAPAANLGVADALRTVPFWQVALGLFACGFSMNLLGSQGVPMLMDHGFDAMTGSLGIGLIGIVALCSTVVLGRLADALERRQLLATIYFVRGLGFFGLVAAGADWQLYSVSVIGGVAWAGSIALASAILADVYGTRTVGVLYGLCYFGHQVGGTISAWLGGWAYETFGTHWIAFGSAGLLLLGAAAISLQLPRRSLQVSPAAG